MDQSYNNAIEQLKVLLDSIDKNNENDCKRIKNYFEWVTLKTSIIQSEKQFDISDEDRKLIRRGNVLWVNFGFNIGSEFGGHHPAIIIRRMGNGVYVIPLDSGKVPDDKKDKKYYIDVPYVYGFSKVPRHCNIYKMLCIDPRRIDFNNINGSVNGKVLDKISDALKSHQIY